MTGSILHRLGQPSVVAEVLIGVALGPHALGLIHTGEVLETLAVLGVIVLMFVVGLKTHVESLMRVKFAASAVGILGVVLPVAMGYGLFALVGGSWQEALFAGVILVATSVGVTARVLEDRGLLDARPARVIMGAAVLDDILGLLLLTIAQNVGGDVDVGRLAEVGASAVGLAVFGLWILPRLVGWLEPRFGRLPIREPVLLAALVVALGMAAASEALGLAAIVGAFFAGLAFSGLDDAPRLRDRVSPLRYLLTPFFFVLIGARVDVSQLDSWRIVWIGLALTVVAVVSKLVSGLGAWRLGSACALAVGVGMVPRGEVALIVASIGLEEGVVGHELFAVAVVVALLTTVLPPPFIARAFARVGPGGPEDARIRQELEEAEAAEE